MSNPRHFQPAFEFDSDYVIYKWMREGHQYVRIVEAQTVQRFEYCLFPGSVLIGHTIPTVPESCAEAVSDLVLQPFQRRRPERYPYQLP